MQQHLLYNLDFIFLFYGVSFFFLGASCYVLHLRERLKETLPWLLLGLFGFIHGLNEWLDLVALSVIDLRFLQFGRCFILGFSFLCLLEFTRQSLALVKKIRLSLLWYIPLFFLLTIVYLLSQKSYLNLTVAIRYAMGLTGAVGASFIFWVFSAPSTEKRAAWFFKVVSVFFFLYAIATGFIVPGAGFFPASSYNDAAFLKFTHIPIQAFRGILSTSIAFLFIYRITGMTLYTQSVAGKGKKYIRLILISFMALYFSFLFFGFKLVSFVDRHERQQLNNIILSDAKLLADAVGGIDAGSFAAGKDVSLYPKYLQVHRQMAELAQIAPFAKSLYLITLREGMPQFVVGSQSQIFPRDYVPLFAGKVPKKAILDAFNSKQATLSPPSLDRQSHLTFSVFVPLLDQKGEVNSLLGMELDGTKVQSQIDRIRLYGIFIIMAFLLLLIGGHAFLLFFSLKSIELEIQKNNLDKALGDLKETEAELARSEETFRGILNNSPSPIFGFDRDLKLIFWNNGAQNLYGCRKDEVINEKNPVLSKKFTEVFGIEEMAREIEKVFLGQTFQWETLHKTKAGSFDVLMTLFPVKDPLDHILFGIGLVQDISEHKRFEQRLAETHAQIKNVLDGARHAAMIATDLKGIITVFNTGAQNMLGYSAEEVVGKRDPRSFHLDSEIKAYEEELLKKYGPELIEGFDIIRTHYIKEDTGMKEWTWVRKDGTHFPVELNVVPLKNEKGKQVGFLGIAIDLTRRKTAEKAFQESQQRYEELAESLNIGVFRTTPEGGGRFLEVNPSIIKIMECTTKEEMFEHPVSDFYRDENRRREFVEKLLAQGYVRDEEIEAVNCKGRPIWVSISAEVRKDKDGQIYFEGILRDISEHKKTELSLIEERDRLKTIATSIGAGLSLVNRNYEIVWVNEVLEFWFGKLESIEGKKCYETYQFKHSVCEGCPTKMAFETGVVQSGEQHVVFPGGKVMDFLLICTPIKNEKGEVEQVLELTLDMTDRHRMVKLLEYERALSKNVIDSISDSLMVIDCRTKKIIDVNKEFLEGTRLNKEDVIGRRCDEVGDHICPSCEACSFDQVVNEGKVISSTHIHQDPEGRQIYADVTLSPLRDERGKVLGVIHVARNVTDRKQLESELRHYAEDLESLVKERTRALQTSELMFRKLFESAQDGIMIVDAESKKIIDVNPSFLSLLECARNEIQGRDYRNLPPLMDSKVCERIEEGLKNRISLFFDCVPVKTYSGKEVIIEFSASLYLMEGKEIIQCNIRDVTERKKMDRIKTEFVSMVSHELRTPLSAIKEGVEIVADGTQGNLNRSQQECLAIALSNIGRLNRLIGDILDISKIQSNLLKINTASCDIYDVIDQVYGLVKIEIEKRGMVLITNLEKDLPPVTADKDRLIQVLMNLLNNAVKFTREKSKITISCYRSGDFAEFSVKDEGQGIPPNELQRLFGKFVQLDSSLIRRVGGTGLGLYISRNLVEAMRGRIWAESMVGAGSVFKFTIPFK